MSPSRANKGKSITSVSFFNNLFFFGDKFIKMRKDSKKKTFLINFDKNEKSNQTKMMINFFFL